MEDLWITFLLFFGVCFGLLLAFFFLSRSGNPTTLWLAMLILSAVAELLNHSLIPLIKSYFPEVVGGFPGVFLIAPMLYGYLRSYTHPTRRFNRQDLWLFVPFGCIAAYYLIKISWVYTFHPEEKATFFYPSTRPDMQMLFIVKQGLVVGYSCFLHVLSWQNIRYLKASIPHKHSILTRVRRLYFVSASVLPVWLVYEIAEVWQFPTPLGVTAYQPLYLLLMLEMVFFVLISLDVRNCHGSQEPRYSAYRLSETRSKQLAAQVTSVVQAQRLYLNPDLTLSDLSKATRVPAHQLSQVFSRALRRSFKAYINELRVAEAKDRILTRDAQRLTLLGVAMECGFNSKSAFNTAFKKNTGLTPSQYRKRWSSGPAPTQG